MNWRYLFLGLAIYTNTAFAQTAPPADLVSIKQDIKKLNVLGNVLYIAAHPDDENTRLLAYLAQEKNYRTGYLSLTRGDGGQNLIGDEQGELLGLIRTQELLAARKTDGAEQFFSRAIDFGFSKNPEETLKIWDRKKVLSDVVWIIRKFRPDVIVCRFPTTGEGGHGHHTSSAILAQEAFSAAADATQFPEQLKYVQTWQAKRLLWNTFSFGSTNTTSPDQFNINVGNYNSILGKGYGEIAAESRSKHKSQGFGSASQRGESYEFFKTILGDAPKKTLMDGINTSWSRLDGTAQIEKQVLAITQNFNDEKPYLSVPALVSLLDQVEKLSDRYWKAQKTKEIKKLIETCAGLWFETYTNTPTYAIGATVDIKAQVINRNLKDISLKSVSVGNKTTTVDRELPDNQLQTIDIKTQATQITQPYWLAFPHTLGTFTIKDQQKVGLPEDTSVLKTSYLFNIAGKLISFDRIMTYKSVDPVSGEVYKPVEITPPVTANLDDDVYIFTDNKSKTISVAVKSFTDTEGKISLKVPKGWNVVPKSIDFKDKHAGDEWNAVFTISSTQKNPIVDTLEVTSEISGKTYNLSLHRINYSHIPPITLFPSAQARLVQMDLKIAGKNIGYIAGAGDKIPQSLKQIGYQVHMLSENEIVHGDLSIYDAIITGIRAYNVNSRMGYQQPKLLDYVKNGGTLLIQYNVSGVNTNNLGPFPFQISRDRVTDEHADVKIVNSQSPVLNYPNVINAHDFDGWIQERGLYFLTNYGDKYQEILAMNDPGENTSKGSILVADYGKGRYVYTSLSFFRQLPAGVPGAYRLFVNLISNPKK